MAALRVAGLWVRGFIGLGFRDEGSGISGLRENEQKIRMGSSCELSTCYHDLQAQECSDLFNVDALLLLVLRLMFAAI